MVFLDKNLREKLLEYDVFFIDFYKTIIQAENEFIEGVEDTLKFLKESKKEVFILTNHPAPNDKVFADKNSKIMKKYGFKCFTSGEICKLLLKEKNYKKYFQIGTRGLKGFAEIFNVEQADFILLDLPAMSSKDIGDSEFATHPKYPNLCFPTTVDSFIPLLAQCRAYNKILVSTKPEYDDFMTIEGKKVISSKQVLDCYRSLGGEVFEVGKPYAETYQFLLEKKDSKKILCVGDTMETDILGCTNLKKHLNVRIDSMLVLSGEFGAGLNNREHVCRKLMLYHYKPDFIVDSLKLV